MQRLQSPKTNALRRISKFEYFQNHIIMMEKGGGGRHDTQNRKEETSMVGTSEPKEERR